MSVFERVFPLANICHSRHLIPTGQQPSARAAFRYHCLVRATDGDAVRAAGRAALAAAARGRRARLTVEMDPQEFR